MYRENAKPFDIEYFVGKNVRFVIYDGGKSNSWYGFLKEARRPTECMPYWEFYIVDKQEHELLIISKEHSFGLQVNK